MRVVAIAAFAAGLSFASAEAAPLTHCLKAEEAYRAGDHVLEIAHYTRCIEDEHPTGGKLAIALNNRGVAYLAVGDADSAIADYDRALALDPGYAVARTNRGMAQLAKGEFVEALRDYDRALALDPAYAPAYANRCWLFGFMGLAEAALVDCDASLRLNPEDAEALDSRAFAYWMLEDQESARRDLELARRLDPARPVWHDRFADFEKKFSVGYPYATASIQSADRREPARGPAGPKR